MHVKRYQNYLEILFFMATSLFGSFPKTSKIPFYTLENPPAGRQQRAVPKKLGYFFSRPSTDIKETSIHYLYESVRMAPLLLWYHGTDCAQSSSEKQTKQKVAFGIFGHSPVILSPVFVFF